MKNYRMAKAMQNFVKSTQDVAKKYECCVSMGTPGHMVVLADERPASERIDNKNDVKDKEA